ncbi:MAG TPA: hypothetical protein VEC60_12410 [Reyranella sp.]|nr:hypothetical protein [Reyranella sp.]
MSEVKHTPTPWVRSGNLLHVGTSTRAKNRIAATFRYDDNADANAAFIVKAVNAHDELVAALTRIRDFDRDVTGGPEMVAIARAALAKAEA